MRDSLVRKPSPIRSNMVTGRIVGIHSSADIVDQILNRLAAVGFSDQQ